MPFCLFSSVCLLCFCLWKWQLWQQDLATEWSARCWTGSWGRWRTTSPASKRCSATSSTPSPPHSASSPLPSPLPSLSYTWTKCLPIGQKLLWPYTHNNNPIYPAAQSNHVHYVNLNVIMTAIVFHRISNCWYMSSIVFCSGRLFGKRMWGFLKNQGGFFSHLCIKSRLVVGFWDFWELFLSPYKCYCYLHF